MNGVAKDDVLAELAYDLTLSLPLVDGVSVKLAWSTGVTTRTGGNFDIRRRDPSIPCRWFDYR